MFSVGSKKSPARLQKNTEIGAWAIFMCDKKIVDVEFIFHPHLFCIILWHI